LGYYGGQLNKTVRLFLRKFKIRANNSIKNYFYSKLRSQIRSIFKGQFYRHGNRPKINIEAFNAVSKIIRNKYGVDFCDEFVEKSLQRYQDLETGKIKRQDLENEQNDLSFELEREEDIEDFNSKEFDLMDPYNKNYIHDWKNYDRNFYNRDTQENSDEFS
jgi:ABC-type antimicrobial peptide transport system permease subunit